MDFRQRVRAHAEPEEDCLETVLTYTDLSRPALASEIKEVSSPCNFRGKLRFIAALIAKQGGGKEGAPLNNTHVNLFYLGGLVVCVGWDGQGWGLNAWLLDAGRWHKGDRVFLQQLTPLLFGFSIPRISRLSSLGSRGFFVLKFS